MGIQNISAVTPSVVPVAAVSADRMPAKDPVRSTSAAVSPSTFQPFVADESSERAHSLNQSPEKVEAIVPEVQPARSIGENTRIKVDINREARRPEVSIVDRETDQVILEIPPEQLLNLSANLRSNIGDVFDSEV